MESKTFEINSLQTNTNINNPHHLRLNYLQQNAPSFQQRKVLASPSSALRRSRSFSKTPQFVFDEEINGNKDSREDEHFNYDQENRQSYANYNFDSRRHQKLQLNNSQHHISKKPNLSIKVDNHEANIDLRKSTQSQRHIRSQNLKLLVENHQYSQLQQRQKRYTLLNEEHKDKIDKIFDKIFGQAFVGYSQHMLKIVGKSQISTSKFQEVQDEINEVTQHIITQVIEGSGPFDPNVEKKACSNFSPNKKNLSPSQETRRNGAHHQSTTSIVVKLTPEQLRKREFMKQLIRMKPQEMQEQNHQAQELIKKLKKEKLERIERFKKKEQEVKLLEEQEYQEIIRKRQEDEEKKKKEIEQRREQIKLRLDLMKEQKQKRLQEWSHLKSRDNPLQIQHNHAHTPQPRVPLYLELEQRFKSTLEQEEEQKRRRVLENIKHLKKPIDRDQIEEHAKKYEDEREKLLEMKQLEREKRRMEQEQHFNPDKFKTKTYQEVALIDLQQKEEMETKEEMKKLLAEKKDSYARYVREMHLPHKSRAKEQELQDLIQSLKHPVRSQVKLPPSANVDGMQRSLSMNRSSHNHTRNASLSRSLNPQKDYSPTSSNKKPKYASNNHNFLTQKPPLPKSDQQQKPPKTDYLKERRIKREQMDAMTHEKKDRDVWLKNINNKKLSKKDKFIRIKEKAREIEELALRKEQLLNLKQTPVDPLRSVKSSAAIGLSGKDNERQIEETLEVNEMLIDAIKAKLAILDDIN